MIREWTRWRRVAGGGWLALLAWGALVLAAAAAPGQQAVRSSLAVSVSVVRSCSVSTLPAPASNPRDAVRISCGSASVAPPIGSSSSLVPVVGAAAPASVSTSRAGDRLVLSVDF